MSSCAVQWHGGWAGKEKKSFLEKRSVKKFGNTFPGLNCRDEDGDAFNCSGTFSLGYWSFKTGVYYNYGAQYLPCCIIAHHIIHSLQDFCSPMRNKTQARVWSCYLAFHEASNLNYTSLLNSSVTGRHVTHHSPSRPRHEPPDFGLLVVNQAPCPCKTKVLFGTLPVPRACRHMGTQDDLFRGACLGIEPGFLAQDAITLPVCRIAPRAPWRRTLAAPDTSHTRQRRISWQHNWRLGGK